MKTITLSIPNIHCGHCIHTIQNEVSALAGVQSVQADLNTKTATITFDAPASEEIIKDLMNEINYPVSD